MNSKRGRYTALFLAAGAWLMLQGAADDGGCGGGLDNRPGEPGINVGGVAGAGWNIDYNDQVTVTLKNAAGVITDTKTFVLAAGGTFDLDGTQVDLSEMCGREEVACPNEVFPHQVTMTQPGSQLHLLYVTYNKEGPLGDLTDTTLLGNVDSDNDFSIALGIKAAAVGTCGLLGVSYARGHIASEKEITGQGDVDHGVELSGNIVTAYSGGCILGGAAAGGTIELKVQFAGTRTTE